MGVNPLSYTKLHLFFGYEALNLGTSTPPPPPPPPPCLLLTINFIFEIHLEILINPLIKKLSLYFYLLYQIVSYNINCANVQLNNFLFEITV